MKENQEIFTSIYRTEKWGKDGAGSGRGSTIENAQRTCNIIREVFKQYDLHSLLDAPCGALEWTEPFIKAMYEEDPSFKYHGVDVVEFVVEENRQRLNDECCEFSTIDLSIGSSPPGYDLILCRDALQHLSFKSIAGVLRSFSGTDSRYLLVNSFRPSNSPWWKLKKIVDNADIQVGDFFRVDLLSPPFSMSEGLLHKFDDYRPSGFATGHMMFLYDLNALSASKAFKQFVDSYV